MTRRLAWMPFIMAAGLAAFPTLAVDQLASLQIDHAFARATPPGAKTGGVFFTVDNAGNTADRLLRASTPIAAAVALHQMVLDGGVMRMRAVPSIEVIPFGKLELTPSGYHLMLLELKQPDAALKEYEAAQLREPNRFRNYLGSARAAEMAGDRAKAVAYYQKLLVLAKDADTPRPEIEGAKKLAQR